MTTHWTNKLNAPVLKVRESIFFANLAACDACDGIDGEARLQAHNAAFRAVRDGGDYRAAMRAALAYLAKAARS